MTVNAGSDAEVGTPTTFTIGVTPASGSDTTITGVSITFGDGDSDDLGAVNGTGLVTQHTYTTPGPYTVTVTATDSGGGTTTVSTGVVVDP